MKRKIVFISNGKRMFFFLTTQTLTEFLENIYYKIPKEKQQKEIISKEI